MRYFLFLSIALLSSGCMAFGNTTRYESHGQSIYCWEPSRKVAGLTGFVADKMGVKSTDEIAEEQTNAANANAR